MRRNLFPVIVGILLTISSGAPAQAQKENLHMARPGSINYVEGQASIDAANVKPDMVGSTELEKGQSLTTQTGKVEILLTPGVFLRLADNSSVRMVSPDLANTEVALEKGRVMVEVLDIRKENNIRIDQNDAHTKLLQKGLYDFDADCGEVRVFKGSAEISARDENVKVSGQHLLALDTAGKLKAHGFNTRQYEDDFFRWSALRSGYLSEAGVDQARAYIGYGPGWYGPGWYGPGWYWDPWFGVWTFLPADGIYYSPFGWGFYSPIVVYHSPFFYYGWGHYPHPFTEFHGPYGHGFEPQGGFHGGGFGAAGPHGGHR